MLYCLTEARITNKEAGIDDDITIMFAAMHVKTNSPK
jgi:hypothetical protein